MCASAAHLLYRVCTVSERRCTADGVPHLLLTEAEVEHVVCGELQVWSPQQCARAIVESGLHYVDALAIANCVAQQLSGDHGAL